MSEAPRRRMIVELMIGIGIILMAVSSVIAENAKEPELFIFAVILLVIGLLSIIGGSRKLREIQDEVQKIQDEDGDGV